MSSSAKKECGLCQKTGDGLNACARCNVVYYCDRECQKLHWKLHKPNCASATAAPDAAAAPKAIAKPATTAAQDRAALLKAMGIETNKAGKPVVNAARQDKSNYNMPRDFSD